MYICCQIEIAKAECAKCEEAQEKHIGIPCEIGAHIFPYVQQFRDAALEALSCGRYIPHVPNSVSINMCSLNNRSRLTSLGRNINTHSKVLPL